MNSLEQLKKDTYEKYNLDSVSVRGLTRQVANEIIDRAYKLGRMNAMADNYLGGVEDGKKAGLRRAAEIARKDQYMFDEQGAKRAEESWSGDEQAIRARSYAEVAEDIAEAILKETNHGTQV